MPESRRVTREQSYASRKGEPAAPRTTVRWPRPTWKFWLIVVLLAAVIAGLNQLFYVRLLDVSGGKNLSSEALKTSATQALHATLLPPNLVWLDSNTIEKMLLTKYPTLAKVQVLRQWPHKVQVVVSERSPALIWKSGGASYAVDNSGYAITGYGDNPSLPAVTDSASLPVKIKAQLVPAGFVSFVQYFNRNLSPQTNLKITGISIAATTSEIAIQTDQNYVLRLDTTRSAAGEMEDLKLVLKQLAGLHQTPAQYIDLRVAGRAYYK